MNYLVDTDWVIDHLHSVDRIVRKLEELAPQGLGLSIISLAELYDGIFNSTDPHGNEAALQDFIDGVSLVGIDEDTSRVFGRERGRLRREGQMISDFDLLIAATCLRHDFTLLSNNRRHFERVAGLTMISA